MLTQRKEKRTVEDFNQFCTFVLAYTGYIPYPAEEQWSYLTTQHEEGAEPTSRIKKSPREAVGKRKCDNRHPTSQRGKKPRKCDSLNTKKPPTFPVSKRVPENNGNGTVQPEHEPAVTCPADPAGSPEHFQGTTCTQNPPGSLPATSSGDYVQTGNDIEEVKDVPDDPTLTSRDLETVSGVRGIPEMEGGEDGREKEDGVEERNQEGKQDDGIDGLNTREREGWTGMAATLQMVMNSRLRGQLPEDQETGYHTDLDGRTPERHSAGLSPSTSPAWGSEDAAEENGKLEDDDSWDLITCFCFKPFAGRPMIECNQCSTWVHLSCAKIRRAHVPEVFVCQPCRDSHQPIRRSNRARVPTRKRLSDQ